MLLFGRHWLLVVAILVHELELLILTRLIDIDDMLLSLFHHYFSDILHVSILRAFLYFNSYLGVLHEDVIVKEVFRDRNGFRISFRKVNEL